MRRDGARRLAFRRGRRVDAEVWRVRSRRAFVVP
jgi:hypothetical protein